MTRKFGDHQVSYPQVSGDHDEYIRDRMTVSAERLGEDGLRSLDPFGDRESASFPGDRSDEATAWLVARGIPSEVAGRIVAEVVRSRGEVLGLIAANGEAPGRTGWSEVGQAATERIRCRLEARHFESKQS